MDVVIYGNGGHGLDIAATLPDECEFLGWWDRDPAKCSTHLLKGVPEGAQWVIGVNDSATRETIVNLSHGVTWYQRGVWVHPDASLGPETLINDHTHVNAGVTITRSTLGRFVTVGPNATICGDVTIGDGVMVGAGAVIKNLVRIGDRAVIGAGAIIVEDVPPGVTMVSPKAVPLVRKADTMANAVLSC